MFFVSYLRERVKLRAGVFYLMVKMVAQDGIAFAVVDFVVM